MEEMNNTTGQTGADPKKGSGALVGSIIIVIIIIIAGIYMLKNTKLQNNIEEINTQTDSVVNELNTQGTSDELSDIEGDLSATNLDNVVPVE